MYHELMDYIYCIYIKARVVYITETMESGRDDD